MNGERRHVMSADMAVQPLPVREIFGFFRQPGLVQERSEQAVGVVFQQNLDVQVHSMTEGTVQKFHIAQGECVVVQSVLSIEFIRAQCGHQCQAQCHG